MQPVKCASYVSQSIPQAFRCVDIHVYSPDQTASTGRPQAYPFIISISQIVVRLAGVRTAGTVQNGSPQTTVQLGVKQEWVLETRKEQIQKWVKPNFFPSSRSNNKKLV